MTTCAYCGKAALRARCDLAPKGDRCDTCTMCGEIEAHEAKAVAVEVDAGSDYSSGRQLLWVALLILVGIMGLANRIVYVDVWIVLAFVVVSGIAFRMRPKRRSSHLHDAGTSS
jgi:hypothetical protein